MKEDHVNKPLEPSPQPERRPTRAELEAAAGRLLRERILSKGGRQPSEATVQAAIRILAGRAYRELQRRAAPPQQ